MSDPHNCGGCGIRCQDGEFCGEGNCEPVCPVGQVLCGTICVDLKSDPLHCGACDNKCGSNDICEAGSCETCSPPQGTACDNECVNLKTDPYNCGGCGNACARDEVCIQGTCELYEPATPCNSCPCFAICADHFGGGTSCCPGFGTSVQPICVDAGQCP